MNRTITIAPVRKSVVVKATPERAFEVFTTGMDRWWPKTHGIGAAPVKESIIEPFVGGRWYTRCEDGSDVVVGHVRVWHPGVQFVVTWEISADWKPDARVAFASEVEVRFVSDGAGGTRVDVEHRNFERMGDVAGETMRKAVDNGWPGLLNLYVASCEPGGLSSTDGAGIHPR
jgi:uncharacterized protein YndB with AHSA1/START domain